MIVYDRLPRPTGLSLTPEQLRVYMKCNGVRPIDEVVSQTGLAREAVLGTAQALQALGLLRSTDQATALAGSPPTTPPAGPRLPPPEMVTPHLPHPVPAPAPAARVLDHDRIWQAASAVYDQRLGRAAHGALEKLRKDLNRLDPPATLDGVKKRLSLAFGPGAVTLFEEILGDEQR